MTLNVVMAVFLCYLTEIGSFWANYVKVIEVRHTLSVTIMYPNESTFRQYMAAFPS